MGTLYYLTKNDPWEVFALNKVYGAYPLWDRLRHRTLEGMFGTPEALAEALKAAWREDFGEPEYALDFLDRAAARAFRWAKGEPITFRSEYDRCFDDEQAEHITGSFHDSDYEPDGTTYIPGSAW